MNQTNDTNTTLAVPKLNLSINYIDFAIRSYDLFIHLLYFAYVIFKKNTELRQRTFIFLHNVNAVTLAISIVQVSFINVKMPSFSNPIVNNVLCILTEQFWACTKYARVYALLLLAAYRYTACVNLRLYKRINSRLVYIIGLILACWLISIVIPNVFKFSIGTTYSAYYCTDGYVPGNLNLSIAYYACNSVLSSMIPTVFIFVLYVLIYLKLKEQTSKTSSNSKNAHETRLGRFSHQFIVINLLTAVATIFSTFIDFTNVVAVSRPFFY